MRNFKKIFVSVLLLVALILSLASCDIVHIIKYGHSYTGGYISGPLPPEYYRSTSFRWFETLDELLVAIEHLKAAGNEFSEMYIPSYENETVDAKYCITFRRQANTEKAEKGKEWYDRQGWQILSIEYFGFLDEITIEELEHSYVSLYKHIRTPGGLSKDVITSDPMFYYDHLKRDNGKYYVQIGPDEADFAWIEYFNMDEELSELPEDYITEFPKSFVPIWE